MGGASRAVRLASNDHRLEAPGPTFDGRDVFAPAAAHLCAGVGLAELGPEIDPATLVPGVLPVPRIDPDAITAEVLWVDRYGNAQLNVEPDDLPDDWDPVRLRIADQVRSVRRTSSYAEIGPGQIGMLVDSSGLLSVAVDRGSAADELGLRAGTEVVVEPTGEAPSGVVSPVELGTRAPDEGSIR